MSQWVDYSWLHSNCNFSFQMNGSMIVGFHRSVKAAPPCHYVFPGVLPSSHNTLTLDMPFLIIIFITLFACLNCLSEPPAWHAFFFLIWLPSSCTAVGALGYAAPVCSCLLDCDPEGEKRGRERKMNMMRRPPTLSKPLRSS